MRLLSMWVCVLVGVACLGLSVWFYPRASHPPGVVVDQPTRVGLRYPMGARTVSFALRNPHATAGRIVGACEACETSHANCQFRLLTPLPVDLPPGAEHVVECELVLRKPGRFVGELHLYVSANGSQEVTFHVEGEVDPLGE
ncbi:hypothetical protein R5W24_001272 [Gemmata sp. JC717]|uniref:hypothetical protein n=1 Tax=Gemmata algarum TaxID=2975278 RepID=UPI0021BA7A38|nr:hypothetical protein [Gemmata algarum]MDY3552192.1 hypothetical protein [Gemmata algarum]